MNELTRATNLLPYQQCELWLLVNITNVLHMFASNEPILEITCCSALMFATMSGFH